MYMQMITLKYYSKKIGRMVVNLLEYGSFENSIVTRKKNVMRILKIPHVLLVVMEDDPTKSVIK